MKTSHHDAFASFRLVMAHESFTKAADSLGLTQPAISAQMKALEAAYGVKLIERVGKKARPTLAGQELLGFSARFAALHQELDAAMARHASGSIGRVRIGTGASASTYLLPKALKTLRERFPAIDIIVSVGSCGHVARLLEDNSIDLAFLTLPVDGRAFSITPVIEDELVFVAPQGAALPPDLTAGALAGLPLIVPDGGATRRLIEQWFASAGLALKPSMSFGSFEAIKELVDVGLGCAIMPRIAVAATKKAVLVRPLMPPLTRTIGIAVRRDKVLHKGLRETIRALKGLAGLPC